MVGHVAFLGAIRFTAYSILFWIPEEWCCWEM